MLSNGCFPNTDKDFNSKTSARVHELLRAPGCNYNLSIDFTVQEMDLTIQHLKTDKAPGSDRRMFLAKPSLVKND
ncbi:hypothetical protein PAMP_003785 [Pampus punctatissimus]